MAGFVLYIFAAFPFGFFLLPAVDGNSSTLTVAVVSSSPGPVVTTATASLSTFTGSSSVSSANNSIGNATDAMSVAVSTANQSSQAQTETIRPSPSESVQATSSVITVTKPSTPVTSEGTAIWDKAIDLATPMGTFIIVIVALALVLILLIVLIWVCCKYNNLKTRTKFPNHVSINDADHHWIQSNDDLLMWERNLRASEVNSNGRGISNRPFNEKRK